jgi:hypothetical protein
VAYRIIWKAIRARKRIIFSYDDRPREACPHIPGYKASGDEAVFVFQVGGESSKPLAPEGDWRCFDLDRMADIQLRDGRWRGGTRHRKAQTCVRFVDVDVNVEETLTRRQPLAFGSPALRPPRQPGE